MTTSRRRFIWTAGSAAPALIVGGACGGAATMATQSPPARAEDHEDESGHAELPATEDLMREHGVIDRILLIYEATAQRIEAGASPPLEPLGAAARIARRFVEDYHERQEEDHVFPIMREAGPHADLVEVLRRQHEAGRTVTDHILAATGAASPEREALVTDLRRYVAMYRPHSAREDTVLFPALREVVSPQRLNELGEQFEELEHRVLGEGGFDRIVGEVAQLEEALGIHDLAQYTPDAEPTEPEG